MSQEEPAAQPPIKYCPLCGRDLWVQNGVGARIEISSKDIPKLGIIRDVLSFCDKCDLMYVFKKTEDGFTIRAVRRP